MGRVGATLGPPRNRTKAEGILAVTVTGMEAYQLAQIVVVFCCLLGLWVRGGRELVQGYIFTVAFMFLVFTMVVLGP